MHILITGGAGYIGSYVTSQLLLNAAVTKITIYDNLHASNYSIFKNKLTHKEKINFIQADILDSRKLKLALNGVETVIYLAGLNDFDGTKDAHILEQFNHWGTSEVCNAIEQSDVQKVIYLSDSLVYGFAESLINEDNEPNPETPYAFSKFRGEGHLHRLPQKIKYYILRPGIIFGNTFSCNFEGLINRMMFDAHHKGRISIQGNGRQMVSITSLGYLTNLFEKIVTGDFKSGTYMAIEQNMQVLDIVEVIKEIYPGIGVYFHQSTFATERSKIEMPGSAHSLISVSSLNLMSELTTFKNNFSF